MAQNILQRRIMRTTSSQYSKWQQPLVTIVVNTIYLIRNKETIKKPKQHMLNERTFRS